MVSKSLSIPRLGFISSIAFLGLFVPTKTVSTAPVTAGSTSNVVVTVGGLISQLVQHDRMRAISLLGYSANRRYQVTNEKGKLRSETQVSLQYQSPDSKEFKIVSESGPAMLRNIVKSLLTFETEAALGGAGYDSSITPANYTFQLAGTDRVDGYKCFAFKQVPNEGTNTCLREESGSRRTNSQSSRSWVVRRKGLLSGSRAQILPDITRRSGEPGFPAGIRPFPRSDCLARMC